MTVIGLQRLIVSVADLARSRALYQEVFGLAEKSAFGDLVTLTVPGTTTELMLHRRPPTSGLAGVAISFRVDDVDAVTAAAEKAGATVIDAPEDQPWGERQAVLTDPDGHVLCLVSV
ncbi:VOC family protein [Actinoplanes oblitus]|uniref:VOC family protein n=1 Tax=Actinoplanes oblitus TaxID=3040509 RepID=A0ABY8WBL6_9ACTN|nr:VOC family protein [Actinoplanes oblitus]WIM93853.1 VOC family protein [Actinoplanes oblitus]